MNLLHRVAATAVITAALAGCKNMGLQDLRTHEQATHAEVTPLVQQVAALQEPGPLHVVQLGGQNWIASAAVHQFRQESIRPVGGTVGGVQFFRMAWDEAPYDRVFARQPHGFVEYASLY